MREPGCTHTTTRGSRLAQALVSSMIGLGSNLPPMPLASALQSGTRLTCFRCESPHDPTQLHTVCESCGMPIRVNPDFGPLSPDDAIDKTDESMWRYSAVGAVPYVSRVTLGEGWTPLHDLGEGNFVKDESVNPTRSFKDRGMSMAVSAARVLGAQRLVAPSAGNAAVALSAYGAEAGLPVVVSMPDDTPEGIVNRCRELGAEVVLVDGDISVAGKWLAANRGGDDFDVSTLKEPFRVEGKKTMGYEVWEQFEANLPDVILYPTGGGTGLVGMWKAFDEMEELGWIGSSRPRLVSVQASGCAPIVSAYDKGASDIEPWPNPETTAWGLRVPSPIGGFLCLRAISETQGAALAIDEIDLHRATDEASEATGIDFCPEGGAVWEANKVLRSSGDIGEDETVLIWNTGSGANYR